MEKIQDKFDFQKYTNIHGVIKRIVLLYMHGQTHVVVVSILFTKLINMIKKASNTHNTIVCIHVQDDFQTLSM